MSEYDLIQAAIINLSTELKSQPLSDLHCQRAALLRRLAFLRNDVSLLAESLEDCNKAIDLEPDNPVAWMERGLTHDAFNKHDEAASDYTQSLSIENSAIVFYNRGVARWSAYQSESEHSAGKITNRSGQIEAILQDYDMALRLDPLLTDAHYNKGTVLMGLKEYARALLEFDKCLDINSSDYLAYFNRAICLEHRSLPRYSDKSALQNAIADYGMAIQIAPTYFPALFNRAACYEMMGDKGRYANKEQLLLAIRDYDQILHEDPTNVLAIYNRGWAFEYLGKVDKAVDDYEKFVRLSNDGFRVGQLSVHIKELLARSG